MLFKGRNALAVTFKRLDEMLQQFVVTFKLRKLFISMRQHDTRTTEFADGLSYRLIILSLAFIINAARETINC